MTYAQKIKEQGRDSYGTWRNGEQLTHDRVAGTAIIYNSRTHEWHTTKGNS